MREMLENKYGAENVTSTTVPPANAKNVRLAGQRHANGAVYDQRGYPVFDDHALHELRLSGAQVRGLDSAGQMRAATRELRELVNYDPAAAARFEPAQLKAIQGGKAKIPGLTWHHHQDVGRMQLVPTEIHKAGHIGGAAMWNGR